MPRKGNSKKTYEAIMKEAENKAKESILELQKEVTDDVDSTINEAIANFYESYTPEVYERTGTLGGHSVSSSMIRQRSGSLFETTLTFLHSAEFITVSEWKNVGSLESTFSGVTDLLVPGDDGTYVREHSKKGTTGMRLHSDPSYAFQSSFMEGFHGGGSLRKGRTIPPNEVIKSKLKKKYGSNFTIG